MYVVVFINGFGIDINVRNVKAQMEPFRINTCDVDYVNMNSDDQPNTTSC